MKRESWVFWIPYSEIRVANITPSPAGAVWGKRRKGTLSYKISHRGLYSRQNIYFIRSDIAEEFGIEEIHLNCNDIG
jgi:hypothetical protein